MRPGRCFRTSKSAVLVAFAVVLAACGAATPSTTLTTASPSTGVSPASASPHTTSPSPSIAVTPSTGPAAITWSDPAEIGNLVDCAHTSVVVTVPRLEAVASCLGGMRWAWSADGRTWTTGNFSTPKGFTDGDPVLGFDGTRLSLAFTRSRPTESDCKHSGLDSPRTFLIERSGFSEPYGAPLGFGEPNERIRAMAVSSSFGRFFIVQNTKTGQDLAESMDSGLARWELRRGSGAASTGFRGDGAVITAYETSKGLGVATLLGGIEFATLPDAALGRNPHVAVRPSGEIDVLWTWTHSTSDCTDAGSDAKNGTYLSSGDGDAWSTAKVSDETGDAALAVDGTTGRLYAAIGGNEHLTLAWLDAGGTWMTHYVADRSTYAPAVAVGMDGGRVAVTYHAFDSDHLRTYVITGR